jgi:hypothetical protein
MKDAMSALTSEAYARVLGKRWGGRRRRLDAGRCALLLGRMRPRSTHWRRLALVCLVVADERQMGWRMAGCQLIRRRLVGTVILECEVAKLVPLRFHVSGNYVVVLQQATSNEQASDLVGIGWDSGASVCLCPREVLTGQRGHPEVGVPLIQKARHVARAIWPALIPL